MKLRRRRALELLGIAALSVAILPVTGGACGGAETAPPDSLAVISSRASKLGRWVAHTHVLYVPLKLFRAPPREGVMLSTTLTYFHRHEVALTEAQLVTIARGDNVRVKDSSAAHSYSIALR
jgi:hypothetical protein